MAVGAGIFDNGLCGMVLVVQRSAVWVLNLAVDEGLDWGRAGRQPCGKKVAWAFPTLKKSFWVR
jgi:hypothetical protein